MILELYWNELCILKIKRIEGLYYINVESKNIGEAREYGFPIFFLKEINIVSEELPYIIKRRLFNIKEIKNKILNDEKYNQSDFERDIFEYVNTTECRNPTDKFSIKIQI